MKKRILFLISNLESGGVSKAMVSLLNTIDCHKYDVSLWMASPHGVFMPQISSGVKVLSDYRIAALVQGVTGMFTLIKHGQLLMVLGSVLRVGLSAIDRKELAARLLARLMPDIGEGHYDLIVDFNGQQQLYYMVDKLEGDKKVTFFHSDYSKWPYYYQADKRYFPLVNRIFTISPHCVEVLKEWFPQQADKICLMENITSPDLISRLAEEVTDVKWRPNALKLVTVGHVTDMKGSHWAIEAAHLLKKSGLDFQWLFVGAVKDEVRYQQMIVQWRLQENVTFVGVVANPYPYIKTADILVHPSQFEGKSIALDEAKLLCKPIVVTNFSTVHDQFENRVNATICEMKPKAIANAIEELAMNAELRQRYISYLASHKVDNTDEINKLYQLLEE